MNDDLEREIRERLHDASLPPAPERLRERLAAVASAPRPHSTRGAWPRALTLLAPLAGVLVVAVAVISNFGQPLGGAAPLVSSAPSNWGPLAVADYPERMAARTVGRLVLTERCAFLEQRDGTRRLLVWPAAQTRWESSREAVSFEQLQTRARVTLTDGHEVDLGGGVPAVSQDAAAASSGAFRWLATPAPECPTGQPFVLSDVEAYSLRSSP